MRDRKQMKQIGGVSFALLCMVMIPVPLWAFDSGSTGADGEFAPRVDTEVELPADGVLNYTSVTIPQGVTVSFMRNRQNTPVRMLVSGDVTIGGKISLDGGSSADVGAEGDGDISDDGTPGRGGPGGFDGGWGGERGPIIGGYNGMTTYPSGSGLGPGGAVGRKIVCGGAGGGFSQLGHRTGCGRVIVEGSRYGNDELLPLIGGSGGAGGSGGTQFDGSGGSGGGGALLIAATGTVWIDGAITSDGGNVGRASGQGVGQIGGYGSGGAIRIVATTISGEGALSAKTYLNRRGSRRAGNGYIRLEAETMLYAGSPNPAYSFGSPGIVRLAGPPGVRIKSVGGEAAPAEPGGNADIVLPVGTTNPVTVEFETSHIPEGNTVQLRVVPMSGVPIEATSSALVADGTGGGKATSSLSVELPDGHSVLEASVSYRVELSSAQGGGTGMLSPNWLGLEEIARVDLRVSPGGIPQGLIWTGDGRRVEVPVWALPPASENPGS